MDFFSHIMGHEKIKDHLLSLWKTNTLPHSLLFYGEPGLGKFLVAKAMASTIVGRNVFPSVEGKPYLEYMRERRLEAGEGKKKVDTEGLALYIDGGEVFWLRPMKAMLKVEQWYELLNTYLSQTSDRPRVVIIEDFQTANQVMANAMLKTIEEPPAGVYFIIVTSQKSSVLPTILSRCMTVSFLPLEVSVIERGLAKDHSEFLAKRAAVLSQGNVGLAIKFLADEEVAPLELAFTWLDAIGREKRFFTVCSLEAEKLGKEQAFELMHWLRILARDMQALRYGAPVDVLQCPLYQEKLLPLLSKWSSAALNQVVKETLKAEEALRLHVRFPLVVGGMLVALRKARKEENL